MLSRYDPFREMMSLRRAVDQLFEQSFVNPRWLFGQQAQSAPMDVYETDQGYKVRIGMPGVKPEDIDVTINQNTLTIKGKYSSETQQPEQQEQEQQGNWIMHEMQSGTIERSVTFERPIDADNVQSSYEHGVLTLTLPLTAASRPRRIQVRAGQQQPQPVSIGAGQSQSQGTQNP